MRFDETACFEVPESVHARPFDDEIVLLDLAHGEYFALDDVGARIWEGLTAGRSLGGLCEALLSSYDVDGLRLREDVASFACDLVEKGLIRPRRAA